MRNTSVADMAQVSESAHVKFLEIIYPKTKSSVSRNNFREDREAD